MTIEEKIEIKNKIIEGLKISYQKLLQFKKEKNSDLIIQKGDDIIRIKVV